jgi:tungstate transport system substrate-binding protein
MGTTSRNTDRTLAAIMIGVLSVAAAPGLGQEDKSIVVASTTSTQDSGLFDYLLPIVKKKTGITVKVIAQGTGQALDTGRRGDADVVLVHAKAAELKFLADGESLKRYPVMYNDFVLIGPKTDPAGIQGDKDMAKALDKIRDKQAPFISRNSIFGRTLVSISKKTEAGGTNLLARAWALRSTLPAQATLMCYPTGVHGFTSRPRVNLKSWLKATNACSTNTASCW